MILAPVHDLPLVAINVWYHVGSGDEVPGKSGFAHLFEHMMFQGSKNTGEDMHFKVLKQVGAADGAINGTTNQDRTNYFEVVPANQVETALWLESDRMGHLLEMLTPGSLANQIDVVRNERRQSYDNRPYTKAMFARLMLLYPAGHPYRYQTIGLHEDLERASIDDVKGFFKTWYVPANATLAIVGDFDPEPIKQMVQKWFGTFPTSTKPVVVTIPAPTVASKEIVVDDPFAKQRQITFDWHSPGEFAAGDAELEIAASALGEEGTGRLYKSLVYDKQLATEVRVVQRSSTFSSLFEVTVTLRGNADVDQVKHIVMDELARVGKDNLSDKEIARVIAQREAQLVFRLENLNNRANLLQGYNQFLGDPDRITWDLDRYRKTTADKIRATFASYITPDHVISSVTNPTGGGK